MECFFAHDLELSEVKGKVGKFVDYMAVIKRGSKSVLVVSNLYNVNTVLRLIAAYFMHFELEGRETLKIIDDEYSKLARQRKKNEARLGELREQIKKILKKESVTITVMWQHGCGATDSLSDFPEDDIRHLLKLPK